MTGTSCDIFVLPLLLSTEIYTCVVAINRFSIDKTYSVSCARLSNLMCNPLHQCLQFLFCRRNALQRFIRNDRSLKQYNGAAEIVTCVFLMFCCLLTLSWPRTEFKCSKVTLAYWGLTCFIYTVSRKKDQISSFDIKSESQVLKFIVSLKINIIFIIYSVVYFKWQSVIYRAIKYLIVEASSSYHLKIGIYE